MKPSEELKLTLELTIHIWQEGKQFVAHALPLDVMSSGPTPEAARRAVDEAVRCLLRTAAQMGTLDQVLEECGFERCNGSWVSPNWIGIERHAVAV
jgi:hypothetical protein